MPGKVHQVFVFQWLQLQNAGDDFIFVFQRSSGFASLSPSFFWTVWPFEMVAEHAGIFHHFFNFPFFWAAGTDAPIVQKHKCKTAWNWAHSGWRFRPRHGWSFFLSWKWMSVRPEKTIWEVSEPSDLSGCQSRSVKFFHCPSLQSACNKFIFNVFSCSFWLICLPASWVVNLSMMRVEAAQTRKSQPEMSWDLFQDARQGPSGFCFSMPAKSKRWRGYLLYFFQHSSGFASLGQSFFLSCLTVANGCRAGKKFS